jgi:hypothetical protein
MKDSARKAMFANGKKINLNKKRVIKVEKSGKGYNLTSNGQVITFGMSKEGVKNTADIHARRLINNGHKDVRREY